MLNPFNVLMEGKVMQNVRNLTLTAVMLALLIALGLLPGIPLGIIPVPLVLQNMGVMLVGLILGPRYGTIAVGLLLLLVGLGLPILTGGRGGAAMFVGPTAGYMLGWLLVPVSIWGLTQIGGPAATTWWGQFLIVLLAGVLLVDLCGTLWLAHQADMPVAAAMIANMAIIPGDILKAGLTVVLVRRLPKQHVG